MVGLGGLNHRPHPYQGLLWCCMHSMMRLPAKQEGYLGNSWLESMPSAENTSYKPTGPQSLPGCP
jgi:hypothetical protein